MKGTKLEKVGVKSNVRKLSNSFLSKFIEIESNDWYGSSDIDDSISNINDAASEKGYAFLTVIPKIRKIGVIKLIFYLKLIKVRKFM